MDGGGEAPGWGCGSGEGAEVEAAGGSSGSKGWCRAALAFAFGFEGGAEDEEGASLGDASSKAVAEEDSARGACSTASSSFFAALVFRGGIVRSSYCPGELWVSV